MPEYEQDGGLEIEEDFNINDAQYQQPMVQRNSSNDLFAETPSAGIKRRSEDNFDVFENSNNKRFKEEE